MAGANTSVRRTLLRQGYLMADQQGTVLRVRISQSEFPSGEASVPRAWLTLKATPPSGGVSSAESLSRLEFEYAIPHQDGIEMLALTSHQLSKVRYGLDLRDGDWVVDVFDAANAPLVVAEVELLHPDQIVSIPAMVQREVSGRHELSNAALAARPLQQWSAAERASLGL
jgi:adenylate cyclase